MLRPFLTLSLVALAGCAQGSHAPGAASAAASAPVAPGASAAAAPEPPPSRYAVGSRTLEVKLTPDKRTVMASEPIFATLAFSVPGGQLEIYTSWMGRNQLGRPENYRVVFLDAQGRRLPVPDVGFQFGGMSSWTILSAGHPYQVRLLLPLWVSSLTPGRYLVRCETDLPARAPAGDAADAGDAPAITVAAEGAVEVVADDPVVLGALAGTLGGLALGADPTAADEAMKRLALLHDASALRAWLRVAEAPDYRRRFDTARALATWDDEQAVAALVRIAATRAADLDAAGFTTDALRENAAAQLRVTAAQSLSRSPRPTALDALLAMRSDPDASVRLTVLHRASKLPDAVATPILAACANDADATVRGEAKRYRAERAAAARRP